MGAILDLHCPSSILWFCQFVITFQMTLEYLWGQLANLDEILCKASLGWGKGLIRFWDRLDQNSGFHGNRKFPLTYNGEKTMSPPFHCFFFFIRSVSNLQVNEVMRTGIKSQKCLDFGQIGLFPTELGALEHLKNFPWAYNGKMVSPS